ncbi:MAG TPA: formate dehydrogenase accessory sulfurtransferase FdhD [Steroidobacteraceae bacterium]|nr:formate dehydrogenase accessory sulfurtransferase FdhD [Steroidobacteraceae bacterium]
MQTKEAVSEAETSAAGVEVTVDRWVRGHSDHTTDRVAEEAPVALVYNGEPHVVMLATPHDLADLARGFTLSEELVDRPEEIRGIEVHAVPEAMEVRIAIAWERFPELLRRRRNLTGRTGCGLCGTQTLEQTVRAQAAVGKGPSVSIEGLHAAIAGLPARQVLNAGTGSVHAAAWVVPDRGIQCVREDVGRHNALDKTLGALVLAGVDLEAGFMLVTSRASYEMVQKAAALGVTFMAALSAPTSFAIRHAQRCGMTLVAFARPERHVVYTHGQRLLA